MRRTSANTDNVMQNRTVTPSSPALVLYSWIFCRNSPHGSGFELIRRGGGAWIVLRCSPRRTATRSALTFNVSGAACSPLAAGCSPLGVRSIFVLGFSRVDVRVIIFVGRITVPAHCSAYGCRFDSHSRIKTNIACRNCSHRGCGYDLGSTL